LFKKRKNVKFNQMTGSGLLSLAGKQNRKENFSRQKTFSKQIAAGFSNPTIASTIIQGFLEVPYRQGLAPSQGLTFIRTCFTGLVCDALAAPYLGYMETPLTSDRKLEITIP
jgi:hypothetical protein